MLGAVDVFLLAVAFTSDVYQSETNRRRHFVDVFLPPPNRNRQERLSTLTQKKINVLFIQMEPSEKLSP